jgi:aspartokinase
MLSIQKYGGSSVASIESIKHVAQRVIGFTNNGFQCVVVISAMGDSTDQLINLVKKIQNPPTYSREYDMLLSVGERVSSSLLTLAIGTCGQEAISYTGSQACILTNGIYGNAKILEIRPWRIKKALESGKIVVVAGFQGYSEELDAITTLGRGGSDTTAVALAHYMGQEVCDIFTDVDGIFTADPNIVSQAQLIREIDYDKMILLSKKGASVISYSSLLYAKEKGIKIHIDNSYRSRYNYCFTHKAIDEDTTGSFIVLEQRKKLGCFVSGKNRVVIFEIEGTEKAISEFLQILNRQNGEQQISVIPGGATSFISVNEEFAFAVRKLIAEYQSTCPISLANIYENCSELFVIDFNHRENFTYKAKMFLKRFSFIAATVEKNSLNLCVNYRKYFSVYCTICDVFLNK